MSCARAHAGARHTDPAVGRAGSARLARTGRARRGKAIGHRVQHGARRQCAACGLNHRAIPPSFLDGHPRSGRVRSRTPSRSMLTPAHSRAPSHSLTGLFGGQFQGFFINRTYRKHERRQLSGPLWPRARCLRARAHVSGHRPCAADARAPDAVACVCTLSRRAECRPSRRVIRTP